MGAKLPSSDLSVTHKSSAAQQFGSLPNKSGPTRVVGQTANGSRRVLFARYLERYLILPTGENSSKSIRSFYAEFWTVIGRMEESTNWLNQSLCLIGSPRI